MSGGGNTNKLNQLNVKKLTEPIRDRLRENYNKSANSYLEFFCLKHDYEYDPFPWVSNRIGGAAEVADLYVDMETIRVDVDSMCDEGEFIRWYDYCLRLGMVGDDRTPNFDSWLRKCPVRSEEEIAEMEKTRAGIVELENYLKVLIKKK